ncbi:MULTISPECIES: aminotransferase class V-fold PLP-dependent enzyme [unclassified Rathayibacter]|uniref:aminotransferase class V-fold PLP-dependent enzyme n=1 Tax=unclassified Rathayibacter TaxID=2609250 RepID=UPI000CE7B935|nr:MULTISPECIES: aminotransferase class V-fold PLP-dependent enzyme [unclassified Rathayibacter]PPG49519.1 aminotransferase [Rathayibacter sp. AY2B3]PPI21074.1 aminotransferase [Rathayibacter sp. AY1B6]PPI26071.1 aminotransferase [Rathayibacter sp. AY1B5]PPI36527.1 aminotransferase [Rathayibacter sp. AY1B1]
MSTALPNHADLRARFAGARGYHNACTLGLPPRETVEALRADLDGWSSGESTAAAYGAVAERARASFAAIAGVPVDRVAIGSQTSAMAAVLAASLPDGARVLCVDGDFSSIVFPFLAQAHRGVTVRSVALDALADSVEHEDDLVVFSAVQSSSGALADLDAVLEAAARHGVRTACDLTQAAGVLPVDASRFDATLTHAYKWLCSPRGVAFLTVSPAYAAELVPVQAGWYSGEDVWSSCYGPAMHLAENARRFDVSPAWQAFAGAEASLSLFRSLDLDTVWAHASGLGDRLCERLDREPQHRALVSWPDEGGADLERLQAAGLRVSGRGGRLRIAFHLWNDESDVDELVRVLRE